MERRYGGRLIPYFGASCRMDLAAWTRLLASAAVLWGSAQKAPASPGEPLPKCHPILSHRPDSANSYSWQLRSEGIGAGNTFSVVSGLDSTVPWPSEDEKETRDGRNQEDSPSQVHST